MNCGILESKSKITQITQDFCSVYKTGTQAIGAGAEVLIAFDTETSDTGFFNTSTSYATIVTAGTYLITAFARLDSLADGKSCVLDIRINDTVVARTQLGVGASANSIPSVTWVVTLAATNTIKIYLTNGDATERTMQAGTQNNGLAIVRLF